MYDISGEPFRISSRRYLAASTRELADLLIKSMRGPIPTYDS